VLVNYTVEALESDQNILLFASQAYQVKNTGNGSSDISIIIKRINLIIHPPARNVFQILSGIISKKVLVRLAIAVGLVGIFAVLFKNYVQGSSAAANLRTPTPVLIYAPFSGQSQNAGLSVDTSQPPDFKPEGDPAVEAPFAFKPAQIYMQDDFNNPAFDNSYDGHKWMNNYNRLESAPGTVIRQANGVLQLTVAPTGEQQTYMDLQSKYMFSPQKITYLGFRFRINDYLGKIQANTFADGNLTYQYADISDIGNLQIDILAKNLNIDKTGMALGSGWHALEMVSQKDAHLIDIFLDGKKIHTLSLDDGQFDRWGHANFGLSATHTTDWVSLQFDDIIFGGDTPINQALRPEDVPYRFTPDTVALHEDFSTPLPQQVLNQTGPFVTQAGGLLSFRIPAGQDEQYFELVFPTGPLNQDNYYATRFRFTSPDSNYWAASAGLELGVINQNQYSNNKPVNPYNLFISVVRHEYGFTGSYGNYGSVVDYPFGQGRSPGSWHTLEMIVKPPDGNSQTYTGFYWVDGNLLATVSMQPDPTPLLDANTPLKALLMVNSGSYRQEVLSGDVDDLVIGTIAGDKIKE
jgi:hypothetical protein